MSKLPESAPTPVQRSPRENRPLASLPAVDYARLLPHLELVMLPLGGVIYEPGSQLRNVYFPTTAIVSPLYVMKNGGASAEIAIVGTDGMVGIARFLGGETTPSRAVVQNEGCAYRLDDAVLETEFSSFGALSLLLLRYLQALVTQMSQTAILGLTSDQAFPKLSAATKHVDNEVLHQALSGTR